MSTTFLFFFRILLNCCFIEIIALRINHNNDRKILYLKPADCLCSKIIVGNNLRRKNAFGKQRTSPAYCIRL